MTCRFASPVAFQQQFRGNSPVVSTGTADGSGAAQSMTLPPKSRRVWLCETIPTLPPRSHQRLLLEGELRGIIRTIFSAGKT